MLILYQNEDTLPHRTLTRAPPWVGQSSSTDIPRAHPTPAFTPT